MKVEQIWLNIHGHVIIFTPEDEIPNGDCKIVKIIFDDGSIATW